MLDLKRLSDAGRDPVVQALLRHLEKRQNNATFVTADLLKALRRDDGSEIHRHEAVRAMKLLAGSGAGRFRTGRRGKPTRLELAVPAKELVEAARKHTAMSDPSKTTSNGLENFVFRFPLRHDFEVCIELPVNLDADARQRLANAILALPIS